MHDKAIHYGLLAHKNFVETGIQKRQAHVCYDLAEAYNGMQDMPHGVRYFTEGLQIAQALDDTVLIQDFEELGRKRPFLNIYGALNKRQKSAIDYVAQHGSIANRGYRDLTGVAQKQAARDLKELVDCGIFIKTGHGRATCYKAQIDRG